MAKGNCPGHPLGAFKGDHILMDGACNHCMFGHRTGGPKDTPRSPGTGGNSPRKPQTPKPKKPPKPKKK